MARLAGANWQLLRFLLVGVLNTAFGYGVFLLLLWLGLSSQLALVAAWTLGVLFNYKTIRSLVFYGGEGRLWRFGLVYLFTLGLNWMVLLALEAAGTPAWLAQGILTLPIALLSFVLQKNFVFVSERLHP